MSHVFMNSFFSGTDSADEISTRIFGVIGKLDQEGLHMCVRAGNGGNFTDLKVEDVFDMEDTEVYVVPESDYSKVTEKTAVHKPITTGFYGGKTKTPGTTYTGSYYGSNSSYDYTASQKIGDTGYKVGHYGVQINSKLDYISEADLKATDEFESCATFGNALRGLYMVRGREEKGFYDAQTAIALLAASRFLIDYYNEKGGDMKQVGYNALRTVYEQAIARSKVSPDAGYAEECAQFFYGIQMALDSVSEELKALSAQEVLKSESEVADAGEEKK